MKVGVQCDDCGTAFYDGELCPTCNELEKPVSWAALLAAWAAVFITLYLITR